jgi:hypothetical protein
MADKHKTLARLAFKGDKQPLRQARKLERYNKKHGDKKR